MTSYLKTNRHRINIDLQRNNRLQFFSSLSLGHFRWVNRFIDKYTYGKVIDLGCGEMPFKERFLKKALQYDTLDIEKRTEGVTFSGDIQNLHFIASDTYDGVVSFDVLEHVPHTKMALDEIYRILKKGGIAIITVPHISRLHEEPHDYYRFTEYALRLLLSESGFEILELKPKGGLFSFLGHQLSSLLLCSSWHIQPLGWLMYYLNKFFCVYPCFFLDMIFFKEGRNKFPLGYILAAKKK